MLKTNKIKFEKRRLNRYQREAFSLCLFFTEHGHATYWVGGAVRDFLLQRENYDIDLATSAKPAQIKRLLKTAKIRSYDVGEKFGTIGALIQGRRIEITTFRREGEYQDSRHPSEVTFISDPREDVRRRDFTINALLADPAGGEIVDLVGGLEDLKRRTIRFVGTPAARIKEDPLRMLRAVRFASVLGFQIAPRDLAAIKKYSGLIKKVSGERLKNELDKIFADNNFVRGVKLLEQTGLLKQIFPEVESLKRVRQSKDFHAEGNAFIHTLEVIRNLTGSDIDLRYAGFFHDIGKSGTGKTKLRAGRPHISFFGHASKSARMFLAVAKRLHFGRIQTKKIKYLLERHMDLLRPAEIQQKTIIKWAKNSDFTDLVRLRIADTLGSKMAGKGGSVSFKDIRSLLSILRFALKSKPVYKKNLLNGNEIMKILKLKQGKKVGEVLEKLKDAQVSGKVSTKKQAEKFVKSLDNHK